MQRDEFEYVSCIYYLEVSIVNSILISICGAPMSGKSSIMYQLSILTKSPPPIVQLTETERLLRLQVCYKKELLEFRTLSGGLLYPNLSFPKIMSNAQLILYVIAAGTQQEEGQIKVFDDYMNQANHLNIPIHQTPWIFVLNKVDVSNINPLIDTLPQEIINKVIPCIATEGMGISAIWEAVIGELCA